MKTLRIRGGACLQGTAAVPGDKSISHRAVILASLATGTSTIRGFVPARDCLATVRAMRALGVPIMVEQSPDRDRAAPPASNLIVHGVGPRRLEPPKKPIDCGGSATTMRLLAGVLAAQPFSSMLTGNTQLLARPMGRIVQPLQRMGATIHALGKENRPPLAIHPAEQLCGAIIHTPAASAQVKSCLLLAGLFAQGETTVAQPCVTRDHTERLMRSLGVCVRNRELESARVSICPPSLQPELSRMDTVVPGDMSSAAFLIAAAAVCANSRVTIQHVGLNPTRAGFLNALRRMGIQRECREHVDDASDDAREPVGDVTIRSAPLRGIHIPCRHSNADRDVTRCKDVIHRASTSIVAMIDELPLLAVAATQARGATLVRQAAELRVKEVDRITGIAEELRKLGGDIQELPDGFRVQGPTPLRGAAVDSRGDHRLAMALAVAGLCAQGQTTVAGAECVDDSFPGFADCLRRLGARVEEAEQS
ncbi:MAG: 3-phosphoshikimate 1-carboxyvinyltransferase [Myxococcota bacterium]